MPRKAMSQKRSREIAERLTETEWHKDFAAFSSAYLRVLNRPETSMHGRVGQTVAFELNPIQLDFYKRIMRAREEGRPGRFIVLKARRMGLSTVTQAFMFHQCLTNHNRRAFVTAVDRITTNNIFLMAKKMYDNLPTKGQGKLSKKKKKVKDIEDVDAVLAEKKAELDLKPELRRNNDNELWMTHPLDETAGLNSRFEVSVADNVHSTRGFEIHYFHGSEIAFWNDPETFMLGLMQTLSDDPETMVVLESTANGTGGYFYKEFWKAWNGTDAKGNPIDSEWEAVFYPWHAMPNYKRALPAGVPLEDLVSRFDDVLVEMVQEHQLSPEQAYWAHRTWSDKCQNDWDLFKQEYPGKPEEAFAFSASRVFAEPDLAFVESGSVCGPVFVGDIVDDSEVKAPDSRINLAGYMLPRLSPSSVAGTEDFWVWENPKEDVEYVVAVDPASGKSTGDYTAIQVVRVVDRVQVAEYRGRIDAMLTSSKAVLIALMYNNALLSWEINGVGHAVSLGIRQTEYWNLYQREQVESLTFDSKFGWSTTVATKPIMVHVGIDIITSRMPVIRSSRLVKEMRMFMELTKKATSSLALVSGDENYKRVKVGAPPGEHDDLVMSWLQAQCVCDIENRSSLSEVSSDGVVIQSNSWDDSDLMKQPSKPSVGSRWI